MVTAMLCFLFCYCTVPWCTFEATQPPIYNNANAPPPPPRSDFLVRNVGASVYPFQLSARSTNTSLLVFHVKISLNSGLDLFESLWGSTQNSFVLIWASFVLSVLQDTPKCDFEKGLGCTNFCTQLYFSLTCVCVYIKTYVHIKCVCTRAHLHALISHWTVSHLTQFALVLFSLYQLQALWFRNLHTQRAFNTHVHLDLPHFNISSLQSMKMFWNIYSTYSLGLQITLSHYLEMTLALDSRS